MVTNPIPYEIHITVKAADVDSFKHACAQLGVKPIVISMSNQAGDHMVDVMTSCTIESTSYSHARHVMMQQAESLSREFDVIRSKIETVPWHPLAPSVANGRMLDKGCHFETHYGVMVNSDTARAELLMFADEFKLHMSKNTFKQYDDGSYCQMLTARSYSMRSETFQEYSDALRDALELRGFTFRKPPRVEYAIWDSNVNHDDAWLN